MGDPAKRRATYDDVLAAPEHVIAEVVHGVLHTQPRPAVPHARASTRLGAELGGPFDRGRGGPGSRSSSMSPSSTSATTFSFPISAGGVALAWRAFRWRLLSSRWHPTQGICEVLSPGTQAFDRADKMNIYAREGVRHAWLVDPLARLLEVWRLEHAEHGEPGQWLRAGTWTGEALVRAEPFDAVEIELAALGAE